MSCVLYVDLGRDEEELWVFLEPNHIWVKVNIRFFSLFCILHLGLLCLAPYQGIRRSDIPTLISKDWLRQVIPYSFFILEITNLYFFIVKARILNEVKNGWILSDYFSYLFLVSFHVIYIRFALKRQTLSLNPPSIDSFRSFVGINLCLCWKIWDYLCQN